MKRTMRLHAIVERTIVERTIVERTIVERLPLANLWTL
jgi:hypothetical protein